MYKTYIKGSNEHKELEEEKIQTKQWERTNEREREREIWANGKEWERLESNGGKRRANQRLRSGKRKKSKKRENT